MDKNDNYAQFVSPLLDNYEQRDQHWNDSLHKCVFSLGSNVAKVMPQYL